MNPNIKRIATESLKKVTQGKIDMNNLEATIDAYVADVIKATAIECSSVVRNSARTEEDGALRTALRVASIEIEDHFGV